mgnify:CR=1 FL=1
MTRIRIADGGGSSSVLSNASCASSEAAPGPQGSLRRYSAPVAQSYNEARLEPRSDRHQAVLASRVEVEPSTRVVRALDLTRSPKDVISRVKWASAPLCDRQTQLRQVDALAAVSNTPLLTRNCR